MRAAGGGHAGKAYTAVLRRLGLPALQHCRLQQKRVTTAEKCRIVEVLAKVAGLEDNGAIGSRPINVYVVAHPSQATEHTPLERSVED